MADEIDPGQLLISARGRRLAGGDPPHRDPDLARLRRGYFLPAAAQVGDRDRHLLRIHAAADARHGTLVFSYASAASLWGCPLMRSELEYVHATQPGIARRTTSKTRIHRGAIPDGQIVEFANGLSVTSRAWTAVELAATGDLPFVLLPLDHLIGAIARERALDQEEVRSELIGLVPASLRGRGRAIRHLGLADGRSGSAGESLSRGQMVRLRIPIPQLQVAFPRADGRGEDIVDFDWPELGTFGEFDGEVKYFKKEYAGDRTPAEVLWAEKEREDRVRRHRPLGIRWGWNDALSLNRFGALLARGGVMPCDG